MQVKQNRERYRRMSEPFPDKDAATEAVGAFYEELEALREKHKMRDVTVVMKNTAMLDGEEGEFFSTIHFGSGLESEQMLAYALGEVQSRREEVIAAMLGASKKRGTK